CPRHAGARRQVGECAAGFAARRVCICQNLFPAPGLPRRPARADARGLQRRVHLLQVHQADVPAESAAAARVPCMSDNPTVPAGTLPQGTSAPEPGLVERLKRIAPFFRTGTWGFVLAAIGSIVGAITEPMIPALMRLLLDRGFKAGEFSLWLVPVSIITLFTVRGIAGFMA